MFDLADPSQASTLTPGTKTNIDIVAFSFEPKIHPDEAAYFGAQGKPGSKVHLAPDYFIPSGSFFEKVGGAMPDGAFRPVAYADFAGKVVKSDLLTNVVGGGKFWRAVVTTYRGSTFDIVMDPRTVSRDPVVGSIITGRFWLSARLSAPAQIEP